MSDGLVTPGRVAGGVNAWHPHRSRIMASSLRRWQTRPPTGPVAGSTSSSGPGGRPTWRRCGRACVARLDRVASWLPCRALSASPALLRTAPVPRPTGPRIQEDTGPRRASPWGACSRERVTGGPCRGPPRDGPISRAGRGSPPRPGGAAMRDAPDTVAEPADLASLVALLSTTWFAAGLSPEAQLSLARLARRYQVPAGTTLLAEGAAVSELGIVLSGRVSVRTLVPERGLVTILTVEPGDIFAKSALVPPYRSTATVVALQDVDVIALDGSACAPLWPRTASSPRRSIRASWRRCRAVSTPPAYSSRPLRGRAAAGHSPARNSRASEPSGVRGSPLQGIPRPIARAAWRDRDRQTARKTPASSAPASRELEMPVPQRGLERGGAGLRGQDAVDGAPGVPGLQRIGPGRQQLSADRTDPAPVSLVGLAGSLRRRGQETGRVHGAPIVRPAPLACPWTRRRGEWPFRSAPPARHTAGARMDPAGCATYGWGRAGPSGVRGSPQDGNDDARHASGRRAPGPARGRGVPPQQRPRRRGVPCGRAALLGLQRPRQRARAPAAAGRGALGQRDATVQLCTACLTALRTPRLVRQLGLGRATAVPPASPVRPERRPWSGRHPHRHARRAAAAHAAQGRLTRGRRRQGVVARPARPARASRWDI